MVYIFDIDGTICTTDASLVYAAAQPIKERINKVNALYDEGHTIIFQTARGMGRSDNSVDFAYENFYHLTKSQLASWGVKYHKLFLGKPAGDIYVDDKGISDGDFFTS